MQLSQNGGIVKRLIVPLVVILLVGLLAIVITVTMAVIIYRRKLKTTSETIYMASYTSEEGIGKFLTGNYFK